MMGSEDGGVLVKWADRLLSDSQEEVEMISSG